MEKSIASLSRIDQNQNQNNENRLSEAVQKGDVDGVLDATFEQLLTEEG